MTADVKPRKALDSSLESQMSYWRVFLLIVGVIFSAVWLYNFAFTPGMAGMRSAPAPAPVVVTATPTVTAVAFALPLPSSTPVVIVNEVVREVIVTAPPEVRIESVYIPGPERIEYIEVTATPTPAPALAPGTVRICVWMAGVKEVYIGQLGAVPGSCREFVAGVGASTIPVQVNR